MTKQEAIDLLGGTSANAARLIGISTAAIAQWPQELPPRIEDRVIAALVRIKAAKPARKSKKAA